MPQREDYEAAVTEFVLALRLLVRRLRSAATPGPQELSWTQTAVVTRLDAEGPATTAELARAAGMKPQSMGAVIAQLGEMGLVERRPHPTDGRQVNIGLTTRSADGRKSAKDAKLTWLAQAVARLDEREQATLFEAGEIIKRLVDL